MFITTWGFYNGVFYRGWSCMESWRGRDRWPPFHLTSTDKTSVTYSLNVAEHSACPC